MSIASEITRLQGVKSDILTAIADKGVTVPADSMLDDCPGLISDIPTGSNYKVIGGKEYRTVVMPDGKIWLAENLDFKFCDIGGSSWDITTPKAWYYNNDESTYGWNGYKCGLLYNWYAVKWLEDHKTEFCPGWHVATDAEWKALANSVGGASIAGTKLKALNGSAGTNWPSAWNGTDDYGFGVLPAGDIFQGNFNYIGEVAFLWEIDEKNLSQAYHSYFDSSGTMYWFDSEKTAGFPIRLVRDAT